MCSSAADEDKYFEVALALVKEAGRVVRDAYDRPNSAVTTKSSSTDLVTVTDQNVEQLLTDGLSAAFPLHKFIGEESAAAGKKIEFTDAPTWIIDPIDGTTNFVHRIPMIGICVGLTVGRQLRIGIVYNPITYELFTARVGQGTYKNGFRIHVSETLALNKSVISATLGIHNMVSQGAAWMDKTLSNARRQVEAGVRGTRSLGSAAINMVYVAQGSLDAYVEYGLHCWDVAAAALIVTEAGGVVIDPTGGDFNLMSRKVLCAGTATLAKELSSIMTHAEFEPEG